MLPQDPGASLVSHRQDPAVPRTPLGRRSACIAVHDHRNGICDLPDNLAADIEQIEGASGRPFAESCRWEFAWTDTAPCCCSRRRDSSGRRVERRAHRHAIKRDLRDLQRQRRRTGGTSTSFCGPAWTSAWCWSPPVDKQSSHAVHEVRHAVPEAIGRRIHFFVAPLVTLSTRASSVAETMSTEPSVAQ